MPEKPREIFEHPIADGILLHVLSIGGFIPDFFLNARLMSEKQARPTPSRGCRPSCWCAA
jgi:hypothetical protein